LDRLEHAHRKAIHYQYLTMGILIL
jgi:hypothetical protein